MDFSSPWRLFSFSWKTQVSAGNFLCDEIRRYGNNALSQSILIFREQNERKNTIMLHSDKHTFSVIFFFCSVVVVLVSPTITKPTITIESVKYFIFVLYSSFKCINLYRDSAQNSSVIHCFRTCWVAIPNWRERARRAQPKPLSECLTV